MKTRIVLSLLGFLLAGKLASQTFTIDSIKIDEVNSRLSVFSKDLDFAHASVYVLSTRLTAVQKTSGGFTYQLPDSGHGSDGNISVFVGGAIDSNWKITLWTENISYRHTIPDSLYYQYGPNLASYPPVESANYYFYFRTADRSGLAGKKIRCPHLNRRSHATWDYTAEVMIPYNYFEDYFGRGNLPVAMDDSTNTVYSGKDSVFFSYGELKNLACSYSYKYSARTTMILASGDDTLYLEQRNFGLKADSSGSVVNGNSSLKGSVWYYDTLATITVSWSNLTSWSAYVSPQDLSVSPTTDIYSAILPNYPNPVSSSTTIPFTLGEGSLVTIKIRDLLGRTCGVIANGYYEAGIYEVKFNAEHLHSGIYYATMRTDKRTFTEPMLVAR